MSADRTAAARRAARDLLRAVAGQPGGRAVRVTEAAGGLACMILVWDPARVMPTARAEARRGGRAGCRADVLAAVRAAGRPLTRKEVVRALRAAGRGHGAGTVAKALADLTRAGELVNPKDRRGYRPGGWVRPATPSLFD